jgi:hypothetical protein
MGRLLRLLAVAAALMLTGCAATGPRYTEVEAGFPTLRPGDGRLLVYRVGGLGGAVRPDVRLNGEVIGKSQPDGFFFVDRPSGRYTVSARTEVEATLDVTLTEGETTYVLSSITLGVFVGHPKLSLQSESAAAGQLAGLAYTGAIPVVPSAPKAAASEPTPRPLPVERTRPAGPVTMDDLNGLLPPSR